jgi:hypothetical protein
MQRGERTTSPDLKISCVKSNSWQVAPVSARARAWLAKRVSEGAVVASQSLEADLREINRLAASARSDGLIIEFNGPHETFHL